MLRNEKGKPWIAFVDHMQTMKFGTLKRIVFTLNDRFINRNHKYYVAEKASSQEND